MSDLLNKASLVMVPSGYKEDTVYSVIPTDGSGDLAFTRASNGTRVNSAGLVEVCPWNLLTYSEEFTNSVWAKYNGTTTTANTTTAPNGTLTADTLEKLGGSGGSNYYYAVTTTNSFEQLTNFFYVKHKSGSGIVWLLGKNSGTFAFFDVINGTALSKSSGMTTSIESVGNGWYKCIFSQSYVGASSTEFGIGLCLVDGTPNYDATSAATQSVYIWGAQSAVGTTAKPYFPTTDRLNVPRLTYQNGGGGCPSLLLEKQSTNIVTYSEQFDNAAWGKYQCSISANQTTSPDGTQNADKLTLAVGSGTYTGLVYRLTTPGANSIFMKNDSIGNGKFYIQVDGIGNARWNSDGTLASVSGGTATNGENIGNGWFRFTYVCSGGAYINYGIENGTTGDSIFIWGAQVEASSYPTSYIPTTSSSATRVADECFKTGISSLIGQTEGTLFVEIERKQYDAQAFWVNISDNSYNNWIFVGWDGFNSRNYIRVGNTVYADGGIGNMPVGTYKIAISYKSGDSAAYVNGVQAWTDSDTWTLSGLNTLNIGGAQPVAGGMLSSGSLNQAVLFKTRLTNAELASLTTI